MGIAQRMIYRKHKVTRAVKISCLISPVVCAHTASFSVFPVLANIITLGLRPIRLAQRIAISLLALAAQRGGLTRVTVTQMALCMVPKNHPYPPIHPHSGAILLEQLLELFRSRIFSSRSPVAPAWRVWYWDWHVPLSHTSTTTIHQH